MTSESIINFSSNNPIALFKGNFDMVEVTPEHVSFDSLYQAQIMHDLRNTDRWIGSIYTITENNLQHVGGMLAIGKEIQEQLPFFCTYVEWERFIRMCKIHDWGETIPGDVAGLLPQHSDPDKRRIHKQKEFFALRILVSTFPDEIKEVILEDYEEYEKDIFSTDITAILVHIVDNIQGIRTIYANGYELDPTDTVTIKKIAKYRIQLYRLIGNDYKAQQETESFWRQIGL